MPREVRRAGKLVPAMKRELYLTPEEVDALRHLAQRNKLSHGEYLGNLLVTAKIASELLDAAKGANR